MTNQYTKKREEGFTIIEVLIVLAIAGLILLIVFLAVPALQRNSRNTSRKSDASRTLGAVQEAINNHNGSFTGVDDAAIQAGVGTPAYYQIADIKLASPQVPATATTNDATVDTVDVYLGNVECNADGTVKAGGTTRSVAIVYRLEKDTPQCTAS